MACECGHTYDDHYISYGICLIEECSCYGYEADEEERQSPEYLEMLSEDYSQIPPW